jgi:multiple sugar transport system substrate-binding protein
MNRKTTWIVLSVLVMSSLVLSACGGAAPATPAAQPPAAQATTAPSATEPVTIRWRTRPDNKAEQDVYQQINDELNTKLAAQGIQLQYDPAPVAGYFDKLTTEYSAGNAPDIAWVGGANTADYTPKGVIMDLKPLADADKSFNVANFYDAPMKELEQGGKLWGLPRDISTLVMYYNKDMFKAKGLEDPADLAAKGQWNWDAFQKAAVALTDPAKKQYGFSMSNWWGLWGWFVNSGGGSLFNADRTACNLTDPGSIKGLQFMADLFLKDKVATPPGVEGGVAETDFHAGNVAMFPNGRWMTPSMRQDKFDWGVVEMPEGPAGKKTWLFWGPYLISAKTKYPEQAWTVLKELTSPEVQAKIAALGTNIPSNKDKAAVDAFLNSKPPADNMPFVKGADYANAEMALFTGSWGDINDGQYQPAIDKIFAGKATPEEAAKEACDNANPLFKK